MVLVRISTTMLVNVLALSDLAVKKFPLGEVLVRQTGATKIAGDGTYVSRNFTIHAAKDGVVGFKSVKKTKFTGKSERRTQVVVL